MKIKPKNERFDCLGLFFGVIRLRNVLPRTRFGLTFLLSTPYPYPNFYCMRVFATLPYSFAVLGLTAAAVGAVALAGCRPDYEKGLQGRWTVMSAQRDSSDTKTLNGVYFDIAEHELTTTMPLDENAADSLHTAFHIEDECIVLQNNTKTNFKILRLAKNKLTLETQLIGHRFVMDLLK